MIKAGIIGATGYAGQGIGAAFTAAQGCWILSGMAHAVMWIRNSVLSLEMYLRL